LSDKSQVESFFREHYVRLFFYAQKMVGSKTTAEDVIQDVFLRMWRQQQSFDNSFHTRSYVYTAIRNTCISYLRHEKVEREYAEQMPGNTNEIEVEGGLELMIRSEVVGQIFQAIEDLPEGCRTVVKLAYFESLKNEEIAGMLGISINTVKTQKARGLQLLRLRLDPSAFLFFACWVLE
jgi:RNA polymerase sigma-70 factor (ECF subfamily)